MKLPDSLSEILTITAAAASYYFIFSSFRRKLSSSSSNRTTVNNYTNNNNNSTTPYTSSSDSRPQIKQIWIFPIAGCRGFCLKAPRESWNLTEGGLEYDREFCLAIPDPKNENAMIKLDTMPIQYEIFAHIQLSSLQKECFLAVSYRRSPKVLKVPLFYDDSENNNKLIEKDIGRYGAPGRVIDCGDEAAHWLREHIFADLLNEKLGKMPQDADTYRRSNLSKVRLVRMTKLRKPTDKPSAKGSGARAEDSTRFQAFGGLHLITREAMNWLQSQLTIGTIEAGGVACSQENNDDDENNNNNNNINAVLMDATIPERYRANIVLENVKCFDEELWKKCRIVSKFSNSKASAAEQFGVQGGNNYATPPPSSSTEKEDDNNNGIPLHFAKHTDRCEVPTRNLVSGRAHPALQPTSTLTKMHGGYHPFQVERYREEKEEFETIKKQAKGYEAEFKGKVPKMKGFLGIEMFHEKTGSVAVGDEIIVDERFESGFLTAKDVEGIDGL